MFLRVASTTPSKVTRHPVDPCVDQLADLPAVFRDPEFRALGSTMGSAYRELFHFDFRTGHYYVVLPEKSLDIACLPLPPNE